MTIPTLIRSEYFDAALEKTLDVAQRAALGELRALAVELALEEQRTEQQCLANRLAAGENPARVGAPRTVQSASLRAAEDVHKLEQRKCRRATSAAEIVASMQQLVSNDIDFMRPLLHKIELPANLILSEQLLDRKAALQEKLRQFLEQWPATG